MTPRTLKLARVAMRFTQRELGRAIGVDANSIWRMEHGQQKITERTALQVRMLRNLQQGFQKKEGA